MRICDFSLLSERRKPIQRDPVARFRVQTIMKYLHESLYDPHYMLFYYDSGFNLVSRNERRARASAVDNAPAPRCADLAARLIEDDIGLE